MRIQHNIAAMNAYRNYTNNTSAVSKNLEKLSSGYKINRAGDDAAGLAISEKMRAQISGLEAAQKNAKDGISLVKTAEGALTEVHDMLNRMVTLATQSANGTYDNETDRAQLQKEVDQLKAEINRIADSSNFNGIKLLDGSMETKNGITGAVDVTYVKMMDGQLAGKAPQPGIYSVDLSQETLQNTTNAEVGVKFTVGNTTATVSVGANSSKSGADVAADLYAELKKLAETDTLTDKDNNKFDVTLDGSKLTFTMKADATVGLNKYQGFDFKITTANLGNATSSQGGQYNITMEQEPVSKADGRVYAKASMKLDKNIVKDGGALKIGDTTYVFAVGKNSKYKNYANVIDLTDKEYDGNDVDLLNTAAGRLTAVAANNKNFIVGSDIDKAQSDYMITFTEREGGVDYSVNNLAGTDGQSDGKWADAAAPATRANGKASVLDWAGLIKSGMVDSAKSSNGLMLQIGDTAESFNQLKVSIGDCHTKAIGIDGINISTQDGAATAIDKIRSAINYVSDVRGTLGATQNRLEHTINNLSVMTENIQDAESTIRDTDIAEEMMAYTKNNILVQSAQAMLAQANQIPQGVLQLLG